MMDRERKDEVRRLFPVTERFAYMNHAATGPTPRPVSEALHTFDQARAMLGSEASGTWKALTERAREKVARLINAHPDEVAFTKNTPEGLSFVAGGLPWKDGDNLVTTRLEFPANVYPWLNLRDRGIEVRFVEPRGERLPARDILDAIDGRTRLVALSWVEFSNGFRNDLAAVGEGCRARGAHLAVDAIQGLGALRCDVAALRIDFLAAACHKWMLGPMGLGLFYCRRELLDTLRLIEMGQSSVTPRESWLDYTVEVQPTAARFEPGALNWPALAGLEAILDLMEGVGRATIEAEVLGLTDRLIAGLERRGYLLKTSKVPAERSGIVSFNHPRMPPAEIEARLKAAGVVVCVREGAVRVSPHFYNTIEEIDHLLEALPRG
jgi:selenocysteine lyase/cysteine desulfurase